MTINITFILNNRTHKLSFDRTDYLQDLIDRIIDEYFLEEQLVIKALEAAGLYSGEASLWRLLDTWENLSAKTISLDVARDNNKKESKRMHPNDLINNLMIAIHQENPDHNEIRKILERKRDLTLNMADFTARTLDILQVAIRGNRTITSLTWTGDDFSEEHGDGDIEQAKVKQYKAEIASIVDGNYQLYWASLLGSVFESATSKPITVENPNIVDSDSFKNFAFQNYNTTNLISFKLRIALDPETYDREKDSVGDVICILNKKYAFDQYNAPLQHTKAYLLTKNIIDNSNEAIIVKILKISLSEDPKRESKVTELLHQIEDLEFRQQVDDWYKNLSKEDMEKELHRREFALTSQYRIATEAQVTLYPLSHQNIPDIRLLFFVRDLEIELARRHTQPAPTIADTDAPIGVYTRFRQQLSDQGKYVPFYEDGVKALSESQTESPHYKFLTQKGYPEIYDNILESNEGTLQDKIIKLFECYLETKSISQISLMAEEISLVEQLKLKMQTSPLSGTQILQAFDQLLLTLYDNRHQISKEILALSYCIDAIFKEERIALVTEIFTAIEDQQGIAPIPQLAATATLERKEETRAAESTSATAAAARAANTPFEGVSNTASALRWFKEAPKMANPEEEPKMENPITTNKSAQD